MGKRREEDERVRREGAGRDNGRGASAGGRGSGEPNGTGIARGRCRCGRNEEARGASTRGHENNDRKCGQVSCGE